MSGSLLPVLLRSGNGKDARERLTVGRNRRLQRNKQDNKVMRMENAGKKTELTRAENTVPVAHDGDGQIINRTGQRGFAVFDKLLPFTEPSHRDGVQRNGRLLILEISLKFKERFQFFLPPLVHQFLSLLTNRASVQPVTCGAASKSSQVLNIKNA